MRSEDTPISRKLIKQLEQRLGPAHAQQRIAVEQAHHHEAFSLKGKFFHLENWYSIHQVIRGTFKLCGLYEHAQRNTTRVRTCYQTWHLPSLPEAFDGLRLLHLSDLHVDMYPATLHAIIETVRNVDYDLCVMTGDYRGRTFGDIDSCIDGMRQLRTHLRSPIYAVLGNHDSIAMLPALEALDIRLLMNEHCLLERDGQRLQLAGIDDAHFFRVDDIQQAINSDISPSLRILLSHTPEVFREAAAAGVDLFLCGHTHGGQICLPGGIPLTLDARCPRFVGKGRWEYAGMQGYTSVGAGSSVVSLRLNCPPEITVHTLSNQ